MARLFHDLWRNDDARKYRAGLAVLDGRHDWLNDGTVSLDEPTGKAAPAAAALRGAPPQVAPAAATTVAVG